MTLPLSPTAQAIYDATMEAMQSAEDMGGPEGQDYINLMAAIAQEASRRMMAVFNRPGY